MAKFAAILEYTSDTERLQEVRPTHREYLRDLLDSGKLYQSGPFPDGSGALIIYDVDDLSEAQVLLANDPFSKAGLITGALLKPWNIVIGKDAS